MAAQKLIDSTDMPPYGYELYFLVFNSFVQLEDKIHIHARACNNLYIFHMIKDFLVTF